MQTETSEPVPPKSIKRKITEEKKNPQDTKKRKLNENANLGKFYSFCFPKTNNEKLRETLIDPEARLNYYYEVNKLDHHLCIEHNDRFVVYLSINIFICFD